MNKEGKGWSFNEQLAFLSFGWLLSGGRRPEIIYPVSPQWGNVNGAARKERRWRRLRLAASRRVNRLRGQVLTH